MKITKTKLKEMVREMVKEQLSPEESEKLTSTVDLSHRGMNDSARKIMFIASEWEEQFNVILKKMDEKDLLSPEQEREIKSLNDKMAELSGKVFDISKKAAKLILKLKIVASAGKK